MVHASRGGPRLRFPLLLTLTLALATAALCGCGSTSESKQRMDLARERERRGDARAALEAYCEAMGKFRSEGVQKRVPLTLAAIYRRFHVLDAARVFRASDANQRTRLEPLRGLLAEHGENVDFLELAFATAVEHEQGKEVGGPSEGEAWVGVDRHLIYGEYLSRRLGAAFGPEGWKLGAEAPEGFVNCLLAAALARLACGFYARALDQAEQNKVMDLGGDPRGQQAEAARVGREAAQVLASLSDRSEDFRELFVDEGELFAGVVERVSFRPGVAPGAYPVDPDLVVPESEFNFREGRARVALAVGEVNAGNDSRAQRYFLEALRHLLLAGMCSVSGKGERSFLDLLHQAVLGKEGETQPDLGGPGGQTPTANRRTILDYMTSIFHSLRRLSARAK